MAYVKKKQRKLFRTTKRRNAYIKVIDYVRNHAYLPGDQIPSYLTLSEELNVSVTLLQSVVKLLAKDGILEVIPYTGMFLRSLPVEEPLRHNNAPGEASVTSAQTKINSKTVIRFFSNELEFPAAKWWREIIFAFEQEHPEIRVYLSMLGEGNELLRGNDVMLSSTDQLEWLQKNSLKWADDLLETYEVIEPFPQVLPKLKGRILPIAVGSKVLFVNKPELEKAGLFQPERWSSVSGIISTCREYFQAPQNAQSDLYGWCLNDVWMLLFSMGFACGASRVDFEEISNYVEYISSTPPPYFVSGTDAASPNFTIPILTEKRALFVIGSFWQNSFLDKSTWLTLPVPGVKEHLNFFSPLWVAVDRQTQVREESKTFAKFLIGEKAQRILASHNGLMPVDKNAAKEHELYELYESKLRSGWSRESLLNSNKMANTSAMIIANHLTNVRTGRVSSQDFLREIQAFSNTNEIKLSNIKS